MFRPEDNEQAHGVTALVGSALLAQSETLVATLRNGGVQNGKTHPDGGSALSLASSIAGWVEACGIGPVSPDEVLDCARQVIEPRKG